MDKVSAYDYTLPESLIADHPPAERDGARMMVLDRASGSISHRFVREFPGFVDDGDLVVLNDTRVIRARLLEPGLEVFLVEHLADRRWRCLVRPGRKFQAGSHGMVAGAHFVVEEVEADGCRVLLFDTEPDHEHRGHIPLPPYIRRSDEPSDSARYQTIYARQDGSVAAPTAGLHFTPGMLAKIPHAFLTLHVGLGTFRPVKVERISEHAMHSEPYSIGAETADAVNRARRVIAVGTTVTRVLESLPRGPLTSCEGSTSIFIHPPYEFHRVGALLTNFHLPRSTLLMLVCAFAGREFTLEAYHEAIRESYRFYSYGDCMLILS